MTSKASDVVTAVVGPFSAGPIVTTTFAAFPIALAMDSASWKGDWMALKRFDSSVEIICNSYEDYLQ